MSGNLFLKPSNLLEAEAKSWRNCLQSLSELELAYLSQLMNSEITYRGSEATETSLNHDEERYLNPHPENRSRISIVRSQQPFGCIEDVSLIVVLIQ